VLNILFIADVVESPNRQGRRAQPAELRRRHDVGLVICNCENSAGGFGLTRDAVRRTVRHPLRQSLTTGNHLWDKKDSMDYLAEEPRLVRPANLPPGAPGEGFRVFKAADGTPVGVVNLLGRVFMKERLPFAAAPCSKPCAGCKVILVDLRDHGRRWR
jgi:calcineurin-like phosphoesterase